MLKGLTIVACVLSLAACAHRGAVRVDCGGVLRAVNTPIQAHEPPVSVTPAAVPEASAPKAQP